ncbi:DUF3857 and transglutaminase domain-containing protein, partial [bacterium]|nr:DUF3857 and transglutaminase domain-containing protein [bacterium]
MGAAEAGGKHPGESGMKRFCPGFRPAAACLALVLFIGCAGGRRFTKNPDPDTWRSAAASLGERFPDCGALILEDHARVDVYPRESHSFSEYTRRTVIRINDRRGLRFANVILPYDAEAEVTGIRARALCPDGRVLTLEPSEIFDTTHNPEAVFFSDTRAKRFTVPGVEPGCFVEIEWSLAVGHFSFWNRWDFQSDVPVGSSSFTVRCPSDWPLRWKAYGIDVQPEVEATAKGVKADHVWRASNLPPHRPEPALPAGEGPMRMLVSPAGMKSWDDAAAWLESLFGERMKAGRGIREQVRSRTGDSTETLKALFELVRDRVRYVAIEVGTGGYQPHFAESVLRRRYGDCKDMTVLLAAAGREAGWTVYPALLATANSGVLDTALVSPAQFNHAVAVAVGPDGNRIWMDATEKTCPYGDLPWYDRNVPAMVLQGDGKAHFIRTPGLDASAHRVNRVWHLQAEPDGTGTGCVSMTFNGTPAGEMRHLIGRMEGDGIRRWMAGQILGRFPGAVCDSASAEALDSLENPLRIRAFFSA